MSIPSVLSRGKSRAGSRRLKAAAIEVPTTVEAFRDLVAEQARDMADIAAIEAEREQRIAEVNTDIEERLARRTPAVASRFASIKAWWEAHGATIAGSKRSAIVAGLNIGHRVTPPSLKLPKGSTAGELIAWLKLHRGAGDMFRAFTRQTVALNREAMISALKRDRNDIQRMVLVSKGFDLSQTDEFFVEPLPGGEDLARRQGDAVADGDGA